MYGTPEERSRINASMTDYTLCEKLVMNRINPEEIKAEWAAELRKRGTNCNDYAALLSVAAQRQNAVLTQSVKILDQSNKVSQTPASTGSGATCFKAREWTSGTIRNCAYNCAGSEVVQSLNIHTLCPLTIKR